MAKNSAMERVMGVCKELELDAPNNFIFVDTKEQSLSYYKRYDKGDDKQAEMRNDCKDNDSDVAPAAMPAMVCAISTSRFGIGNREGSNMTPPGLHRIEEKIGGGATPRTIFRSREDTGEVWKDGMDDENQILTRILRLRGLEEGVNAGPGIDSYERYIYIHGTNREELIGTPMSHGCVCMKNDDVIRLFDMVDVGTMVYIG
jgi:L,D-peptidoglycan transpeptidase YkuD (ErfK/YbiS/YcfS/YnhG family)